MNRKKFFDFVRKHVFKGRMTQAQVECINLILDEAKGLPDRYIAYILATAYHESAHTMEPVRETKAENVDRAIAILERAWKMGRLPWVKTPYWRKDKDGKSWLGRGLVQLTHKFNYVKASQELGVDFVADPTLAMRLDLAVRILVEGMVEGWFTGKKLSDYDHLAGKFDPGTTVRSDFREMRRIINGRESAAKIALIAQVFDAAFEEARK